MTVQNIHMSGSFFHEWLWVSQTRIGPCHQNKKHCCSELHLTQRKMREIYTTPKILDVIWVLCVLFGWLGWFSWSFFGCCFVFNKVLVRCL